MGLLLGGAPLSNSMRVFAVGGNAFFRIIDYDRITEGSAYNLKTSVRPLAAAPRIFRENKKRETIPDSCTFNRVAEVAGGFNVRGSVPSHLYTKDAPTARRIFDHLCKTTFATQSAISDQSASRNLSRSKRLLRFLV
jgi:hypothetical protein